MFSIHFIKKKLDKRITFDTLKNTYTSIKKNKKIILIKFKNYTYFYFVRFRRSTVKKIVSTCLISLCFYFFIGSFNLRIFDYEGLLFFSEYSFSYLGYSHEITNVSYDIVILALKYFLFFRIFTVVIIYLLITEMRVLPGFYDNQRLYLVLKGYQSGIIFPFIGPWLLLFEKKDEYYALLFLYKVKQFYAKVRSFMKKHFGAFTRKSVILVSWYYIVSFILLMIRESLLLFGQSQSFQLSTFLMTAFVFYIIFIVKYEENQ